MKGELEELGEETDGDIENLSKMQGQILKLTNGKVNIFDNMGEFKSTYEIMQGIAEVWDDLNSTAQADLLETVAGKHRANDVAALLSNWKNVESATQSATEATGSAAKEHEKYVNSIQGKLNTLQSAWQSFANTFFDSSLVKGSVDILTGLVDVIDTIIDKVGLVTTLGGIAGIIFGVKNKTGIQNYLSNFFEYFNACLSDGEKKISSFRQSLSFAWSGMGTFGKASLVGLGIGAAISAVTTIISLYQEYKEAQRQAWQETIDNSNKISESFGVFEQAYIKYSGKNTLTTDEENELQSAINGTIDALGNKSAALESAANASGGYLANLENIAKEELKAQKQAAKEGQSAAKSLLLDDGIDVDIDEDAVKYRNIIRNAFGDDVLSYWKSGTRRNPSNNFSLVAKNDIDSQLYAYHSLIKARNDLADANATDRTSYKQISDEINNVSSNIENWINQTYNADKANYQLTKGIPKTTEAFYQMQESVVGASTSSIEARAAILDKMTEEYSDTFDLESIEAQMSAIKSVVKDVEGIKGNEGRLNQFEALLDIKTQFDDDEVSVGDYLSKMQDVNNMIDGTIKDQKAQEFIRLKLGIELDDNGNLNDEVTKLKQRVVNNLTNNQDSISDDIKNNIEGVVNGLTKEELEAADIVISTNGFKFEGLTKDSLMQQIKDQAKLNEALKFTIDIEAETESIESLNTALSESRSATGLTTESMEALKSRFKGLSDYDAATLFQETANGISLNSTELNKLNKEYVQYQKNEITNEDKTGKLDTLKKEYDSLAEKIRTCNNATEKAALISEREDIRAKIVDLAELATMYDGLASSYNEWQNAEASGNNRDMYSNVYSAMEGIQKELDSGWIDDGTTEFFQLIWGEDKWSKAGNSIQSYRDKWATLDDTISGTSYSLNDFFKASEDGELTSEGLLNFFDAVGEKQEELGQNWIEYLYNDEGEKSGIKSFNFGVDGDKAIADALGISEELVQIFLRASQDAGFAVNFDGTYTQLADLQNEAIAAQNRLNEIFKEEGANYSFDFNSESLSSLQSDLEEAKTILGKSEFWNADGTFNFDASGATEAMTIVSTLQATIDNINGKYIKLETDDASFQEPLEKLQEYERKTAELNQYKLDPQANTEKIEAVESSMSNIVDYFAGLDEETKIKLGIDGLEPEQIKQQIESGQIEIPATVDLQMKMSESLQTLTDIAMLNSGLLSNDEKEEIQRNIKAEYNIETDDKQVEEEVHASDKKVADIIEKSGGSQFNKNAAKRIIEENNLLDGYSNQQMTNAGKFAGLSGSALSKYSAEQQRNVMNFVKDYDFGEEYSAKEREVLIKFVADTEDVDSYTPEQKQAIAKYVANHTEVDSYTPEQKNAIAKYIAEHGDPDSYTPEQKEAWVNFLAEHGIVDSYQPADKTATATYNKDSSAVDGYNPPDIFRTVTYTIQTIGDAISGLLSGGGGVDGTAHVNGTAFSNGSTQYQGTAFKQGSWGTQKSGTALGGELGTELLVRNGRWYTIGEQGAEFFGYKKDDIIFNADQTRELFEKGKITHGSGRGKALASGTAFSRGTGAANPWRNSDDSSSYYSSGGSDSSYSDSSEATEEAEEFEETLDWIEIKINRIERAISSLDLKASSIFKKWTTRNSALVNQISEVRNEIEIQQAAYNRYLQQANSVGLDESYASKVRDGTIDVELITDEDLNEKINQYREWYEKAIDCRDAVEELNETVSELYKQKFDNIVDEFDAYLDEIEHRKSMLDEYINQSQYKANGRYTSSTYYNQSIKAEQENIAELNKEIKALTEARNDAVNSGAIEEYSQAWYEMGSAIDDAKLKIEECKTAISELYRQKFDSVSDGFEGYLAVIEHNKNMLDKYINQSEVRGWIVSTKYYEALTQTEKKNIAELKKQKEEMTSALNNAVDSGAIEIYSQQWYEMCNAIDDVTLSIMEGENAILEYAKAIREIDWSVFDIIQTKIGNVADESQFLIDLMENKELYNKDNGQLTKEGIATMGLHGVNYNVYMAQADKYAQEIKKINKELASDPYNQDILERKQELIEAQQESILNAEKEKNAIKDMVEEGIKLELDALKDLIDKRNESLDSQRDMYEYNKKIAKQTKEIASLQKQLGAYASDDSEEARSVVQKLKVSLEEAKEDLEQTEYDKYISDQEKLLDDLYTEYETILNLRLDNIDALLSDMIDEINAQSTNIGTTIIEQADNVGYTITESMRTIWSGDGGTKSVITKYGDNFTTAWTTTNTALNTISSDIANMVWQLNKVAGTNVSIAGKSSAAEAEAAKKKAEAEAAKKKAEAEAAKKKAEEEAAKKKATTSWRKTVRRTSITDTTQQTSTTTTPVQSSVGIGGTINAGGATIYASSYGDGGGSQYFGDDPIYVVVGENNGYWLVRWHGADSGYTGWFRKEDVSAYATGKKNIGQNEYAWTQENGSEMIIRPSDGAILTPIAKGDSVLNAAASENIWDMANSPSDFIKDALNVEQLTDSVGKNNISTSVQNFDKIVFSMPNVKNYDDMLKSMQKDRNFERLINSMTTDRMVGKSSIAKGKAIR